jgi:hypothetical protein
MGRRSLGDVIKRLVFGLIGVTVVIFGTGIAALWKVNGHYAQVHRTIDAFERT